MVTSIQDAHGDTDVIVVNDEGASVAPVVRVLNNMLDVSLVEFDRWRYESATFHRQRSR
jgi:hypothetical protein